MYDGTHVPEMNNIAALMDFLGRTRQRSRARHLVILADDKIVVMIDLSFPRNNAVGTRQRLRIIFYSVRFRFLILIIHIVFD